MKLACVIRDLLEFTVAVETSPWPGETAERVAAGARYRAVALQGFGWDLEKVSGEGPEVLRILDSELSKVAKVVS